MLGFFVINLLNILAEYRLIRPRRLSIRRYSARFRRIIVNYQPLVWSIKPDKTSSSIVSPSN